MTRMTRRLTISVAQTMMLSMAFAKKTKKMKKKLPERELSSRKQREKHRKKRKREPDSFEKNRLPRQLKKRDFLRKKLIAIRKRNRPKERLKKRGREKRRSRKKKRKELREKRLKKKQEGARKRRMPFLTRFQTMPQISQRLK
jgi:hypothetical protein